MIGVAFYRVRPDAVDRLRSWMVELARRSDEVRQTHRREGVTHERAFLLEGADGPILVFASEMADEARAGEAFRRSRLPIDLEHKVVMADVLDGAAMAEPVFDMPTSRPAPSH